MEYGLDEMVIIFDGLVEIYILLEDGTEFNIETLSKGSIINPHQFINPRLLPFSARTLCNTTYYILRSNKFASIAQEYPKLGKIYNNVLASQLAIRDITDKSLDYSTPKSPLERQRPARRMRASKLKRCKTTLHMFKNAVIYYLNNNR